MQPSRIGIDFLTVWGLSPVEHVHLAADLGCGYVSITPASARFARPLHPPWSLRDDLSLRRALVAALRETGVAIGLGDGFVVGPGRDRARLEADIELMAELGAARINTLSLHTEIGPSIDEIGRVVELARRHGLGTTLEAAPGFIPGDLPAALEIIAAVGRPELQLLIDTMHMGRSGATPGGLAALDPSSIGYVQLCDVPLPASGEMTYLEEASTHRLPPGEGDLPLAGFLAALPTDVVVGLEVPNADQVAVVGAPAWAERCVAAARVLLEGVDRLS